MAGTTLNRPYNSLVPGAIDGLVALLTAAFAGAEPTVLVKDGPWVSEESARRVVCIGWQGFHPGYQYPSRSMSEQLLGADIDSTTEIAGMGYGLLERFTINCAAMSLTERDATNVNTSANRAVVYDLVRQVGALLQPPGPYPGGILQVTMAADHKLYQVADSRGLLHHLTFSLACEGFAQQLGASRAVRIMVMALRMQEDQRLRNASVHG